MDKRFGEACDQLYRLGVTANYKGCRYTAYAIALCAKEPDMLMLVTKNLYPEVARQYCTTWQAVERNIRTISHVAWKTNRTHLRNIAGYPLYAFPAASEFISIMTAYLQRTRETQAR